MSKKHNEIEQTILRLLMHADSVKTHDIIIAHGLVDTPTERRAVQRAFKSLIKQKKIIAKGEARARVYILAEEMTGMKTLQSESVNKDIFKGINLSSDSKSILKHLNKSLNERVPVGYNRNFLMDYIPNKSFFLSAKERLELLKVGTVEQDARPAGTYARNIFNRLLIDLSWNSSRLEGNTYSLLETQRLIELGEVAEGKDASDSQMILNHKEAIEFLIESVDEVNFDRHTICSLHALLSDNLLGDSGASGRFRTIAVAVSGSTYMPIENPHLIEEVFDIFIEKIEAILDPFEQAFFALIHLPYLQAFEDVNKRTSRLAANIPLIKKNLKPLSFVDVTAEAYAKSLLAVYEKNDISLFRDLFLWAYKRSTQKYSAIQQSLGEPNLIKLKYRSEIKSIIRQVIKNKITGAKILRAIKDSVSALELPKEEEKKLIEAIEMEIVSLHEGSIARFQIRPSEFKSWLSLQNKLKKNRREF